MKRITFWLLGLITLAGLGTAKAQPGSLLTEAHTILKSDAGSWDTKMKIWPQGPDGPVIESQGEEHNRVIGNGMWLLSDYKGKIGGVPFEGHGTFGYDPQKKKYTGTWVDNMKPTMDTMEGTYDAKTHTMTMFSQSIDPETGKPSKMKNVGKYIDDNTRTFTMYNLAPGSEDKYVKMMEIHYTRKQKEK
jgi:hypothetical protein